MQIAVIGIGCYYPGAKNIQKLWENILARRKQFRQIPEQRLPLTQYYSTDRNADDKTYGSKAALVDGYQFNWAQHSIPKAVYESTDIAHWIALDTALAALADSGYTKETLPGEKTGVIVGNTLTGEITRANLLRLRWPYVKKNLLAAGEQSGLSKEQIQGLADILEQRYKSPFPAITEDSLAGGLSNTIAGRICNYLNLNGGGFTVDGACSSSLLAIATTMSHLASRDIDLGITGGIDISLDPFELIGFAKAQALSSNGMHVYDQTAQGFIPGEGAGFIVLKRHEDAVRDRNYIYAVVNGWGISSDGKGGLIAPSAKGQSLAIQRAYRKSTYGMDAVDFIEGHGTGTRVGDAAELNGISLALGEIPAKGLRSLGVTSIKSIIGHTKAAAGVAGFLKAVMAVNQRIIPPTAGCKEPTQVFQENARHLYPVLKGQVRSPEETLRAGVTGAGFGGINCHITLSSGDLPSGKLKSTLPAEALMASHQPSELFIFDASTRPRLIQNIKEFQTRATGISDGELPDLAFALSQATTGHAERACIIAATPEELPAKTQELLALLTQPDAQGVAFRQNTTADVMTARASGVPKIGFLYPGQGSQLLNSAEFILDRFEEIHQLIERALHGLDTAKRTLLLKRLYRPTDRVSNNRQLAYWENLLAQTETAQPAICLASMAWTDFLSRIGIKPHAVGGHSLGELPAFYAAGLLNEAQLITLATYRGEIMAQPSNGRPGAMLALGCDAAAAQKLLAQYHTDKVTIANINTPDQTVVSGAKEQIAALAQFAQADRIAAKILPVSNGFHSYLMNTAAEKLNHFVSRKIQSNSPHTKLFSSVSGKQIEGSLDLAAYLSDQMISRVDFVAMVKAMAIHCDFFVEVGPKAVLSKCVGSILHDNTVECYPVEPGGNRDTATALNRLVGACFVKGQNIDWQNFYHNRLIRPFVEASQKSFIINPCEAVISESPAQATPGEPETVRGRSAILGLDDLESYFEQRKQFILDVIKADMRTLLSRDTDQPPVLPTVFAPTHSTCSPAPAEGIKPAGTDTDTASTAAIVYEMVAQLTGFDTARLSDQHKLLDDLNLDSIKSATLVGNIAKRLKVQKHVDPIQLANAAIGDLIALFSQSAPSSAPAPMETSSVEATVLEMTAQLTGFDPSRLSLEHKLLDDLNLDSIKSATLVGNIAKQLNLSKNMDPIKFANASLKELVALFSQTDDTPGAADPIPKNSRLWIRNFTENLAASPLIADNTSFKSARVLLLQTPHTSNICAEIRKSLEQQGHQILLSPDADLPGQAFSGAEYHLIVPIRETHAEKNDISAFLTTLLTVPRHLAKTQSITFVQMGRRIFSLRAFARTLHLEHPSVKIKVIEFPATESPEVIGRTLPTEIRHQVPIAVAVYDRMQRRHEPVMQLSNAYNYKPRRLSWSIKDTLLVTGGARGITKACALAFAAKTCAKLAILGRTPADDPQIIAMLDKANQVGIRCRYYACDITQLDDLCDCVKAVTEQMGPITGIIHGAGLNHPKPAAMLTAEEASREIAPKLLGAMNLMEIFAHTPLKIFAAFSSIIGITGMPGNAAYGFSNESLTNLLKQYKAGHPTTQILAVAYSIWGETGMGVDLGSANFLAAKGILAIPTAQGVARFLELMEKEAESEEVVVSANLGNYLDTWRMAEAPPNPAHRFMEEIRTHLPRVELTSRVKLNLTKDDYLKDHCWRGSYMFPTVFGLEAMAQAVSRVTGRESLTPLTITDITLERPIVVTEAAEKGIEINALVREQNSEKAGMVIDTWITTDDSDYEIKHFSATFTLAAEISETDRRTMDDSMIKSVLESEENLPIRPKQDLYGWLLFQGEQFQRIGRLRRLTDRETVFDTQALPKEFVLGDPFCRDTLLHAVQLPIPKDICLPVNIERIIILDKDQEGRLTGQATITSKTDTHYLADVLLCDGEGRPTEALSGYRLKILEHHDDHPTAAALADASTYNEQRLQKAIATLEKAMPYQCPALRLFASPGIDELPKEQRHEQEIPLIRRAMEVYFAGRPGKMDPAALEVKWDAAGKPFISGDVQESLSLSHDNGLLLTAIGRESVGCDLQTVVTKSDIQWRRLLTPARMALVDQLVQTDTSLSMAGTRLWSVLEVLQKTGRTGDANPIEIAHRQAEIVVFTAGRTHIATWPVKFALGAERIMAVTVTLREEVPAAAGPGYSEETTLTGPQDQAVYTMRHPLSFKDTGNLGKGAYFSNYFMWMGKVRELPLKPVYADLIPQFTSGRWGLVTNHSKIVYLDEATSHDTMETQTWIGPNTFNNNASFPLCYEWHKITPDGQRRLVAVGEQSTSWVEIVGHGQVELRPTPDYLNEFFTRTRMLPQNEKAYLPPTDANSPLSQIEWGEEIYTAPAGPQIEPVLEEITFQTTLEDANLVGNVYFGNYPIWQGRVRDQFFYTLAPRYYNGARDRGELFCVESRVDHLREAMPFDQVLVRMSLKYLTSNGLTLWFDYFRKNNQGELEKLATGSHKALWVSHDADRRIRQAALPQDLLAALCRRLEYGPAISPASNAPASQMQLH